ncbi:MAG: GntR family transcriptional regulator [Flavobacteriaceae bacterium CG_4_8_14_3_um_filter_34_10]|nr:GntR family transcriptional regulator [Flavobacteriia bacterium]OIP50149.1 MAG: GntR family transcriptional regulator [Flavobacteriaceae bacterium CG2_30_34_30]PIQ18986.1 MAG: GntR family transcriptional regulator [Flavobacteriaceae bacterium CG18_big_fil_WC_8_21_14_2_50_34_36]PIV49424.1 MAG: GntR family transcriptional regulator [Flavobacteriaceae bacterium CG02_land_8_20_14_3_00_34_13]PIX10738.1 MAG: GntR family transcriptional regulator [Flavobacteriaceae bacterium CG_4_8_14_3_um_filter_3
MIEIGQYNNLEIIREAVQGVYLADNEGNEVLLPNKYVPKEFKIWDTISVFVYLDHEERITATTIKPYVTLQNFGYLRCMDVNEYGAFVDWNLEKQLFVPFKEQARPMQVGNWYIVYAYLDEKTNRLVGSSKTKKYLSNENITLKKFDKVDILVTHLTEKGANVIINRKHEGLIYKENIFEDIRTGDRLEAYIKKVREDGKIDVVLQEEGYKSIEPNAQFVLEELQASGGFLPLHDKSNPEEIKNQLGLSKKLFKKAIGTLYKDKKIEIKKDGIELL